MSFVVPHKFFIEGVILLPQLFKCRMTSVAKNSATQQCVYEDCKLFSKVQAENCSRNELVAQSFKTGTN